MSPDGRKAILDEALRVVERCRTGEGFRASAHLYPELWMRDLVFSEEVLLRLGHAATVRRHFESFLRLQRSSGQLPTVVTAGWRRVMNQRFHFWTCDTEILFLIGTSVYERLSGDTGFTSANRERLLRCRSYVLGRRNEWGLIPGGDWRDAVPDFAGRCLLSNQAHLVDMLEAEGLDREADTLRERIRDLYFDAEAGRLANSVSIVDGSLTKDLRIDCLGSSLAILNRTVSGKAATTVAEGLSAAKTKHGFRNMFPPMEVGRAAAFKSLKGLNAFVRNGAVFRNRENQYQNSTIWPFIEARIASAFRTVGMQKEADETSETITGHSGLFEWYSPLTGLGGGSRDQLWTAAAVLAQTIQ